MSSIDKKKFSAAKAQLKKNNLDGIIISDFTDMKYLIGEMFIENEAVLLLHKDILVISARSLYEEPAKRLFPEAHIISEDKNRPLSIVKTIKELGLKKIAFDSEKEFYNAGKIYKKASCKETTKFIDNLRVSKTENELAIMRQAAQIAYGAMLHIKNFIKVGITEQEAALEIETFMKKRGASAMSFQPLVSFGKNGANPHHLPDDTKLKKEDAVLFDFGCVYKGYCSDITRSYWFGKTPDSEFLKILELTIEAHDKVAKEATYGMTGAQIDAIARGHITKGGYGKYFTHRTGHGIGMLDHEEADISALNKNKIGLNYCFSVEPGIYLPSKFGVRWEDCFYMTKKGIKQIK